MYLTEILESAETLSVFEKIAQIFWGDVFTWKDLFEFIGAVSGVAVIVFGPIRWIKNNIFKISAPYRAYIDDIDAVLGKESRKLIEKYYIPTRGQDIDPCNEEEIRENNGKYNTEKLIPFLCEKAFSEDSFGKHYIILADSGMGKTTFLVNLYRHYVLKRWFWSRDRKNMRYIPLSSENCMEQIRGIENQGKTILLLDALDESKDAMIDCDVFMNELLKHTENFYKIVITCRTHFFSDEKNEPENTGLIRAGTGNKNLKFTKKYITPFSDNDIHVYLRKRFRFRNKMRRKAEEIVKKVPVIMARPLILNWIDCLVETDNKLEYTYQIYETIIDRWIRREPEAYTKGKLLELSRRISKWMMEHTTTHIPALVVERMAEEDGIELLPIVAKSRSLLNRNSNGEYKFAHRSFLEYFLSEYVFDTGMLPVGEKYLHRMSGFRRFLVERFKVIFGDKWKEDNNRWEWLQSTQNWKQGTWMYSVKSYTKSRASNTRRLKMRLIQIPMTIKIDIDGLAHYQYLTGGGANYAEFLIIYGPNGEKNCRVRKNEYGKVMGNVVKISDVVSLDSAIQANHIYLPWHITDVIDHNVSPEVLDPKYSFNID